MKSSQSTPESKLTIREDIIAFTKAESCDCYESSGLKDLVESYKSMGSEEATRRLFELVRNEPLLNTDLIGDEKAQFQIDIQKFAKFKPKPTMVALVESAEWPTISKDHDGILKALGIDEDFWHKASLSKKAAFSSEGSVHHFFTVTLPKIELLFAAGARLEHKGMHIFEYTAQIENSALFLYLCNYIYQPQRYGAFCKAQFRYSNPFIIQQVLVNKQKDPNYKYPEYSSACPVTKASVDFAERLHLATSKALFWGVAELNLSIINDALRFYANPFYESQYANITPTDLMIHLGSHPGSSLFGLYKGYCVEQNPELKHRMEVLEQRIAAIPKNIDSFLQHRAACIAANVATTSQQYESLQAQLWKNMRSVHGTIRALHPDTTVKQFLNSERIRMVGSEVFSTKKKKLAPRATISGFGSEQEELISTERSLTSSADKGSTTVAWHELVPQPEQHLKLDPHLVEIMQHTEAVELLLPKHIDKSIISQEDIQQILQELIVGNLQGISPFFTLREREGVMGAELPSIYKNTLTGAALLEGDYFLKHLCRGLVYIPPSERERFTREWRAVLKIDKQGRIGVPSAEDVYKSYSGIDLSSHSETRDIVQSYAKRANQEKEHFKITNGIKDASVVDSFLRFDHGAPTVIYNGNKLVCNDSFLICGGTEWQTPEGRVHYYGGDLASTRILTDGIRNISFMKRPMALLDLVYCLQPVAYAMVHMGRIPDFTGIRLSGAYNTPDVLPPTLSRCPKEYMESKEAERLGYTISKYGKYESTCNGCFYGDPVVSSKPMTSTVASTYHKAAEFTMKPVVPYEVGTYSDLVSRSTVGDRLDIHHVAQKHPAYQVIQGYDEKSAPSIALPRVEHSTIPTIRGEYTDTARSLLAKDIRDLRTYTSAPTESMQELVRMNKEKYTDSLTKNEVD